MADANRGSDARQWKFMLRATVFGLGCALLGAAAMATFSRMTIELELNASMPAAVRLKPTQDQCDSSDAGLTLARCVATEMDEPQSDQAACETSGSGAAETLQRAKLQCDGPFAFSMVPLHERPEYLVGPGDTLRVIVAPEHEKNQISSEPILRGRRKVNRKGIIDLEAWGLVPVEGLTVAQIRRAIESVVTSTTELGEQPKRKVEVSVLRQGSRSCTVINYEVFGPGVTFTTIHLEGYETALEAASRFAPLAELGRKEIYIARPTAGSDGIDTILPVAVHWTSEEAMSSTNPRLLPGDRVIVKPSQTWMAFMNYMRRQKAIERRPVSPTDLVSCQLIAYDPARRLAETWQRAKLQCDGPFAFPMVPLHERPDYRVESPDILRVEILDFDPPTHSESTNSASGDYLVDPTGNLPLRDFGKLPVAGQTLAEIRAALERRVDAEQRGRKVRVSVQTPNSHVYYVLEEGQAVGDSLHRYPLEGNETALDVLARHGRLSELKHKRIFIARPTAPGQPDAVMPVDWNWTSEDAMTCRNPVIQAGDRIFIASPPWWMAFLERTAALAQAAKRPRLASELERERVLASHREDSE